jgi:hypothetical protein
MPDPNDITRIWIRLTIDGNSALFLALTSDGNITRQGSGTLGTLNSQLFIGLANPDIFHDLRKQIGPELLSWFGKGLEDPNPRGKVCELKIQLLYAEGKEVATVFRYGAESLGPPPEMADFVTAAVRATDPWFERFQAMAATNKKPMPASKKPWWRFW